MTKRDLTRIAVLALLSAGAAVAPAVASDLWLHVRVDEAEGARVKVNLPVSMIEKAVPMLSEQHVRHGMVHLEDHQMSITELRELWWEMRDSPDMTFVAVEDDDEDVKVWKEAGYLRVQTRGSEGSEQVDVRVPVAVVDALLSGEGDELDLQAAMEALVAGGEGELVSVTGGEDQVRVWVDRTAEAD